MKYINSSKLDERIVRSDLDHGYREGRQFGRGRSGGQVRDEYRLEFDAGRGGWGHVRAKQEAERERDQKANYEAITTIPEGANLDYKDRKDGMRATLGGFFYALSFTGSWFECVTYLKYQRCID
jgi:nuclear cap-binding protein subunit 2